MTVAKDLYLLSLTTSVACQIVSFSYTEAMEFFMDSNYLQYTMKYIRCNNHPLALHYLVVSLLHLVIHFYLNYVFIPHIWQACILCFIFFSSRSKDIVIYSNILQFTFTYSNVSSYFYFCISCWISQEKHYLHGKGILFNYRRY